MKKLLLLLLFIPFLSCDNGTSKMDIDSALRLTAQKMNEMCPMVIDNDTRLDNVAVLSNRTIQYNYTLVNINIEDINSDLVKNEFIPILNNKVKTNDGLKNFRINNVTLSYYYGDKNGKFIFKHKVTPEIYNK